MNITFNTTDALWEVPISRAAFNAAIARAVRDAEQSKHPISYEMAEALRAVGRTATRALMNVTKNHTAQCGCPAIIAQMNMGKTFEESTLSVDDGTGEFPGRFDGLARMYVEGCLAAGAKATGDTNFPFGVYQNMRLVVTD